MTRWSDFIKPEFNRDYGPSQISYWQIGCNDAKAGKPFNSRNKHENGYKQGYYYGQHGRAMPVPFGAYTDASYPTPRPDPPLVNPYMEGIAAVEGILTRLQTFTKEFPKMLDSTAVQDYGRNLLEVRDTLHRFRQAEMNG